MDWERISDTNTHSLFYVSSSYTLHMGPRSDNKERGRFSKWVTANELILQILYIHKSSLNMELLR